LRRGDNLVRIRKIDGFVSPRLGVRFDLSAPEMVVRYPDGRPFLTFPELAAQAEQARSQAEHAKQRESRLTELARKFLERVATAEELAELRRLIEPPRTS